MPTTRTQAWLTYVTRRDHLTCSFVLAESLRKSGTSKKLGVIACKSLSSQDRLSLRHAFDHVFLLPESAEKPVNGSHDIEAKLFAFSLDIFEKCVFLEPRSMVTENADWLFEREQGIFSFVNGARNIPTNSAYFLFRPCHPFYEYLNDLPAHQNEFKNSEVTSYFVSHFKKWMENNAGSCSSIHVDDITPSEDAEKWQRPVIRFSLQDGNLCDNPDIFGSSPIIHFVDGPSENVMFTNRLIKLAETPNVGCAELAIIREWLRLLQNHIRGSPKSNVSYANEPIAIIGISCRLPGANSLEEFWNLLYSGEEGVREPPVYRWKKEHTVLPAGKNERKTHAGFLSTTVDEFDAKFFGVSPKEALFMDPQTRLLHEVMWESLENAGVDPHNLHGSHTGIFTGSWMNDYKDIVQWSASRDFFRTYMGNSIGAAAARLSFMLGATGPSIATESGCSSAIVAVDMAVKSLRCGETNMALAGGVNLVLHPFTSNIMDYVIAPDGRCKTFDAKADGFGRAEGCGFLVLKRLSDAFRDRDHIWALIRGSAVTQEGISRSLGTPTVHCEALAMHLALRNAGVRPEEVSFVETHGTGTGVGDPMEVAAIAKAYHSEQREGPLIIGSVKTNLGHTESLSGITGIIKTVLAMQHELIPKHLHFETLNPDINLELVPAKIPLEPTPWPRIHGHPRLAGVSSFGITGTDGHVILQESPGTQLEKFTMEMERPLHILKISTKSKEALDPLISKYRDVFLLERLPQETFADFAFTANAGRASFDHRVFLLASDFQTAAEAIDQNKLVRAQVGESGRKICFLFTGQGSQYPGMAKLLYQGSPVFRFHFDYCARTLQDSYSVSLYQVLWDSAPNSKELSRTIYSQTSIFCIEYCLFRLWQSWGLEPDYVLGHSLGEFCAAVVAGMISFQDALKLVAVRSGLIDKLPRGSMLVLRANQNDVEEAMNEANIQLDFAAVNSSDQTVVAGDSESISKFLSFCKGKELKGMVLEATHAFHSSHMDPMLEEYRRVAQSIRYTQGNNSMQYISGMEGKIREELDANYWVQHTREKVNFLEACQTLKQLNCTNFLELGPQPVLSTFVLQNIENSELTCYPSLRRNTDDWETILTSLGKLWLNGFNVNWAGFDKPYSRKKVTTLPFYPFNRKSYWVECNDAVPVPIHPLIGAYISNASKLTLFQNDLNLSTVPYIKDHCIGNKVVFPGAGFTEMCLSAGFCAANFVKETFEQPTGPVSLENVKIEQPLELKEGKFCRLQAIVDLPENDGVPDKNQVGSGVEPTRRSKPQGFRCKVFHRNQKDIDGSSSSSGKWVPHATATFYPVVSNTTEILGDWNGDKVKEIISTKDPIQMEGFYKRIDAVGLKFGETFRSIQKQWTVQQEDLGGTVDEVVAEIKNPHDHSKYLLHPLIIDAMFQTQIVAGLRTHKSDALRVPIRVGKLVILNHVEDSEENKEVQQLLYVHAKWTSRENCCVVVCTQDFIPIALMEDVELLETNVKTIQSVLEQQNSQYPDCWEETWKPITGPVDHRIELVDVKPVLSLPPKKGDPANEPVAQDTVDAKNCDRLVSFYTLRALFQLGWVPYEGEKFTAPAFCEKYKINSTFKQLVYFYFTMLQDELDMTELSQEEGVWKVKKVPYKNESEVDFAANQLYNQLIREEAISTAVKSYENVAKNLCKILNGQLPALSVLFPPEGDQELSVETYYLKHPCRSHVIRTTIENVVECLSLIKARNENNPKILVRVLEVGGGTGSLSLTALEELRKWFGSKVEYYFTDISASFFIKADKKLEEFRPNLKYATFNIEEHPINQGIPVNYFDFVLASDVLHTTRNIKECLRNVRMTIRPQGILTFNETVVADKGITFMFGLLDGYWRFEDFDLRPHHPCVSPQMWSKLILSSGFSYVRCREAYLGLMGCITAEADVNYSFDDWIQEIPRPELSQKKKRWLIFSPEEDVELMQNIAKMLRTTGHKVDVVRSSPEMETEEDEKSAKIYSVLKGADNEDTIGIIYAWGMNKGVTEQRKCALPFMHIAKYILLETRPPRLFVLTKDVHPVTEDSSNPTPATLSGMLKSMKNENADLFVRCIDLDGVYEMHGAMTQILYELAMHKDTAERERLQVAYRQGQRYEPRFSQLVVQPQSKSDLMIPLSTDSYQLKLPESRIINDLEFVLLEEQGIGENEVEVRTKAYALNFRDIFAILKPSEEFEKINAVGLDFAGVVSKVGSGVTPDKFNIGDRVFGINIKESQLPSHVVVEIDSLVKIPGNMTFAEASTLPAVFCTSIQCLVNVAKLKKGETVLIHTGSGGVGLSAIQLAQHIGANIISTAGSKRKRAYLRSLGIEHVFNSRDTSYEQEILKVTNERGVDVVLNSITGPGFKEATLAVCAQNARFVEMSKLAVWTEEEVKERRPDVQYSIVDLTKLEKDIWSKLQNKTQEYLEKNKVKSIPFVKYDVLRIRQALQYFQKAKHIGKVVVTMPDVKIEEGQWKVKVSIFNADSTYLITGGLGGIGFEVCKWMLDRGATDIVLMGRNPPKPEISKEIKRLNAVAGNNVTVKLVDVGNFDQLKELFGELAGSSFKPIRGVQHCAGVLWDSLYANQSWESFTATFHPKVVGTWNLHQLTKDLPLEHFVLYSSMTALVGGPGQANHAAANCFEDAFAHYRYSMGLPATTVNWGQWAQVGCAKEVNVNAILPVSVARMMNGLEEVMRNQRVQTSYGDFESLSMLTVFCPTFKHYMDERLLKRVNDSGQEAPELLLQSTKFWEEIDSAETTEARMEVVTSYMKAILRNALRMEPDEPIKDDASMQDLGVDSLMLIELRNNIQGLLGSRLCISASMLKDCQTIRQLVTVIVQKLEDDEQDDLANLQPLLPAELEELIREDGELEESIKPENPSEFSASSIRTVLVTGATGQLGPYIVARLSQISTLEKIICLIRIKELEDVLKSMSLLDEVDMSKVECVKGRLTKENFGLEKEVYDRLCGSVDAVIHLAGKSNYTELYRKVEGGTKDVRSVNVGGTKAILRFAATQKTKCVYYASALFCVFGGTDKDVMSDDWPESEEGKTLSLISGMTGYPISKFVSEMMMKHANERGIPCKVFRFPYIMGEKETGRVNYKNNNNILRFLSYLKLKAMPTSPIPAIMLPVDICADWSLNLFFNDMAPCEIYNIAHPTPQLEAEFVHVAKEEFNTEVELVEWKSNEFVERLYASDIPTEVLKEMYQDIDKMITVTTSSSMHAIHGYMKSQESFFRNPKLKKFIPDFEQGLPTSMDIIRNDLVYVKSTGYFAKFGL